MDCPEGKIRNPVSKQCINIGGQVHKRLIKEGVMQPFNQGRNQIQPVLPQNAPVKQCKENEVPNPRTNRCIKIGSFVYKKLVKEGLIKVGNVVPQVEFPKKFKKTSTRKCINSATFMMFEDVQSIPESDFLRTPDGYCYSASELISYIDANAFNNKNPHEQKLNTFREEDIDTLLEKHPELLKKLKNYFLQIKKKNKEDAKVFEETLDVFYAVANTGRVCYYNNLSSHEKQDSSVFQRSIECLQDLSERINKLNGVQKEAYAYVSSKIRDANNGNSCIHGIGMALMFFFIDRIPKTNLKNDLEKTGLYFIKNNNDIYFYSYEHRFTYDFPKNKSTNTTRYNSLKNLNDEVFSKDRSGRSEIFKKKCIYEPYLATENVLDDWSELPDWRKVVFEGNACFDMMFIVKVVSDYLNTSKNNNPYPRFPQNPFTQKELTEHDLKNIKHLLNDNYVYINPAIRTFLNNPELWKNSTDWSSKMIDMFSKKLRYVRLNNIVGEELHCNGYWDEKNTPVLSGERKVLQYLNTANRNQLQLLKNTPTGVIPKDYYYFIRQNFVGKEILVDKD